nr:MAG TPA: hypothetical protein [Caudoviricetes sp.]
MHCIVYFHMKCKSSCQKLLKTYQGLSTTLLT